MLHDLSWKCFRGQKNARPALPSNFEKIDSQSSEIKTSDWLSNADDWGSDTEECKSEDIMEQDDDTGNEIYNCYRDENVLHNLKGLNLSNTKCMLRNFPVHYFEFEIKLFVKLSGKGKPINHYVYEIFQIIRI